MVTVPNSTGGSGTHIAARQNHQRFPRPPLLALIQPQHQLWEQEVAAPNLGFFPSWSFV